MTYVLGLDISTKRVDAAAIPLHEPPRLGQNIHLTYHELPKIKAGEHVDPAERAIRAGQAARTCLYTLHARGLEIHSCAVEHPGGKHVHPSLWQAFGAICHALDEYPVASLKAAEWRRGIGCMGTAINAKAGGSDQVMQILQDAPGGCANDVRWAYTTLAADELDAIGIALAHRNAVQASEEAA